MRFLRPDAAGADSGIVVGIIIVAAGTGSRLGHPDPKAFVPVAGRPILAHALEGVFGSIERAQVVIVAPADWAAEARELATEVAVYPVWPVLALEAFIRQHDGDLSWRPA